MDRFLPLRFTKLANDMLRENVPGLVQQFQSANKLPHVKWILPNAPHNHDAMAQAWYTPRSFSPIPMPKSSHDDEEEEDDEEGMKNSVQYISGLIDREVHERGVPAERIVVGGFSQGCAIALLMGLTSKYRGELGGIVGLSGYLPLVGKIETLRAEAAVEEIKDRRRHSTKFLLAHGTRDQLVPMRLFRQCKEKLEALEGQEVVESHTYEGMPHSTSGPEIRDLCSWLERVVPSKDP